MARLFILGNGYDIAHNIKDENGLLLTDYNAFKRWLIERIIKEKEPNFDENNVDLSGLFDKVSWISNEFVYREFFHVDYQKAMLFSKNETDAAQFASAKAIIWLYKHMEAKLDDNTWESFEDNLGKLEDHLKELITITGIASKNDLSIDKVTRVMTEIKILWKMWVKSICLPTTIEKNDYDINIIKNVEPNDIVLSTNYTETFERLFEAKSNIFHIHGDRRNNDDIMIVGHGNDKYSDFCKAYEDITIENIVYSVEWDLYKPVSSIIIDKEKVFSKIKEIFDKDENNEIFSFGFSFSKVDRKYIEHIYSLLNSTKKIKWFLTNYDRSTEQWQKCKNNGETYKEYLEKIGFDVKYTNY